MVGCFKGGGGGWGGIWEKAGGRRGWGWGNNELFFSFLSFSFFFRIFTHLNPLPLFHSFYPAYVQYRSRFTLSPSSSVSLPFAHDFFLPFPSTLPLYKIGTPLHPPPPPLQKKRNIMYVCMQTEAPPGKPWSPPKSQMHSRREEEEYSTTQNTGSYFFLFRISAGLDGCLALLLG